MPTIQINKADLESLVGLRLSLRQIEDYLPWVKGEIKGYDTEHDELRIELNDTNRPDLWCVEGIARQIRQKLTPISPKRADRKHPVKPLYQIRVERGLDKIRPYIGGCVAKGLLITEGLLVQLIQTQEKLAELYGRKRQTLSVGLYRLEGITFPVTYTVVEPSRASFVPLNSEREMTLEEILREHPKGREYAHILKGASHYPLLLDQQKQILSFPPIINSRDLGEVRPGDRDFLIEVTGTDLRMLILTVNIWAANLADRGATIEPVEVLYPRETDFGKRVIMPSAFSKPLRLPLEVITKALGEEIKPKEVQRLLTHFGHWVKREGKTLIVVPPFYRDDLLHPVDVAEEVAISRGYDRFTPQMPAEFTVGELTPIERFSDLVRNTLVGMGFQEMNSNILCSGEEIATRMRLGGERVIRVENRMSESYSVLRDSLLPSLLKVEAASSKAFYPHRIFEVGEVVIKEANHGDPKTEIHLGALLAHPTANFSEAHACLEMLFYYMDLSYRLEATPHPSYLEGRVGRIFVREEEAGFLGEIHPEVLERWSIGMPCSVFEISLDTIFRHHPGMGSGVESDSPY